MAKPKTGDKVAYTPTKSEAIKELTIGTVVTINESSIVLNTRDGDVETASINPRRFKKLTADGKHAMFSRAILPLTSTVIAKPEASKDASTTTIPTATTTATSTTKVKSPRPGSKKFRAIAIYKEVNGDRTTNLDRTTIKKRFEAELELGSQGSSTYYQNIKSRQNGWWF